MKKMIVAVVLMVAVGASAFAYMQKVKDERVAEMHAPLLASLKDPESAQFKTEHYTDDGKYLCGEMNSKNGMGGYVGFKRFISDISNFALEGYSTDNFFPDSDSAAGVNEISKRLELQIAIMKNEKRIPTDEEVYLKLFDDLWHIVGC